MEFQVRMGGGVIASVQVLWHISWINKAHQVKTCILRFDDFCTNWRRFVSVFHALRERFGTVGSVCMGWIPRSHFHSV